MREIGSEFWQQSPPACGECAGNEAYLLSGRTALRFILEDIRGGRNVQKALLPSYCCDSIIIPFLMSGIHVDFYPVHPEGIDYPFDNDADVVLLIDYFGYVMEQNREIACREKQQGKVIIYDSTHKLDGNPAVAPYADYSFCSYRKWFYCNYAKAAKHSGAFASANKPVWNAAYLHIRDTAAREKARYIAGERIDKQGFLADFGAAEEMLEADFTGYAGIPVEADVGEILVRRKRNAAFLIRELKNIPQIRLWREDFSDEDSPMFVPILVDPCVRNDLRKYLTAQQIYCPIHWPWSACHSVGNDLYERELSLVCDQRYDLSDMERMAGAITDYFTDKR